MQTDEIRWNQEARDKILTDSDRVLQEAVQNAAKELKGEDWETVYQSLFEQLKGRFIDFEPGPDLRKYAEAVSRGEIEG
ncbi:hypothetical protein [Clavibacter zhangzhiyongii]|jgi:hypothetical protein|uniref:Uncharacterized protein n=1 Tax=Clavibacter zhangzhiyongii TaxID=2768071 RepID=A0A7L7Z3K3_9MICO|nr:hypothetical protein [Clavibacter zhangzhiyongii]MBM7026608.1 hypothetical protein [Clavibacter zhangzhiyongii]QOD44308.1 hypothetical protein H9X71_02860 [Clavibacter zhangzhiyongii]